MKNSTDGLFLGKERSCLEEDGRERWRGEERGERRRGWRGGERRRGRGLIELL